MLQLNCINLRWRLVQKNNLEMKSRQQDWRQRNRIKEQIKRQFSFSPEKELQVLEEHAIKL